LDAVYEYFGREQKILPTVHIFSCDSDKVPQKFILHNREPDALFENMSDLKLSFAKSLTDGHLSIIRHSHLHFCGWPCVLVSHANANRKRHRQCIAQGDGATGEVFGFLCDYLGRADAVSPDVLLGENVAWPSYLISPS
jgi:hypothetical protein